MAMAAVAIRPQRLQRDRFRSFSVVVVLRVVLRVGPKVGGTAGLGQSSLTLGGRVSRKSRLSAGIAIVVGLALLGGVAQATSSQDWPSYLLDRTHSSASGSSSVTVANAGTLTKAWSFVAAQPTMSGQPQRTFYASPTVAGNLVFIGSNTGVFYASQPFNREGRVGAVPRLQPKRTCGAIGLVSTAAVDTDPATGAEVVYVGGGDGYCTH